MNSIKKIKLHPNFTNKLSSPIYPRGSAKDIENADVWIGKEGGRKQYSQKSSRNGDYRTRFCDIKKMFNPLAKP